jgi:hypothetical protein
LHGVEFDGEWNVDCGDQLFGKGAGGGSIWDTGKVR